MNQSVNIFTCCNGQYTEFIPIFALSHLYHNPDAVVEIGVDSIKDPLIQAGIDYVNLLYPGRLLVRECQIFEKTPHLTRFIETPHLIADNVYISDVDIICLVPDITAIHLADMKLTGLPYSNIVRSKPEPHTGWLRLTGLHFTPWNNYYPIPDLGDLLKSDYHNIDEAFLYQLISLKYPVFNYENDFRPVHGIHVSVNRNPLSKVGWGIDNFREEWKIFRNTVEFLGLEKLTTQYIKNVINIIDDEIKYNSMQRDTQTPTIFRDDDIDLKTNLDRFIEIHELFNKYNLIHTIAVVTTEIETRPDLIEYIKSQKNIDIQLHGHRHIDHTLNLKDSKRSIRAGILDIERIFGTTPTTFYPPWNKSNSEVEELCKEFGLTVSTDKVSLSQFCNGIQKPVINFHFWADECIDLERAMLIELTLLKNQTDD
jgi:hypothetical protein